MKNSLNDLKASFNKPFNAIRKRMNEQDLNNVNAVNQAELHQKVMENITRISKATTKHRIHDSIFDKLGIDEAC